MVNLIEYTPKHSAAERKLFLSPVLLQSKTIPIFSEGELKLYVYESLEEEMHVMHPLYVEIRKTEDPNYNAEPKLRIKFDQDFSKYYLGCLILTPENLDAWHWEGDSSTLNQEEIMDLILFLRDERKIFEN